MSKKNILIIIFVMILVITYKAYNNDFFGKISISKSKFPPSNIECFNSFMDRVNSGYSDGFRIPEFNFSDITYFRCASTIGFNQYEITGRDKNGQSFYIHKDEGGMAASGADSIYNFCYKQNDIIIRNEKLYGREPTREAGTCFWTNDFPSEPTSTYEYNAN